MKLLGCQEEHDSFLLVGTIWEWENSELRDGDEVAEVGI